MLESAKLVAFVPSSELDRSLEFYGGKLGLELGSRDDFACEFDAGGGTRLRVTAVKQVLGAPYTVLGWRVEDIEAMVAELSARGVLFEFYDGLEQDANGIWTSPSGTRVAWFKDPDENTLSLSQAS
jgi:catechol 2,3-dioxygenase-like lactoylglutathione lyase family enzyme